MGALHRNNSNGPYNNNNHLHVYGVYRNRTSSFTVHVSEIFLQWKTAHSTIQILPKCLNHYNATVSCKIMLLTGFAEHAHPATDFWGRGQWRMRLARPVLMMVLKNPNCIIIKCSIIAWISSRNQLGYFSRCTLLVHSGRRL